MLADKIAGFRSEVGTIPSNVDLHKLPFYLWGGWRAGQVRWLFEALSAAKYYPSLPWSSYTIRLN
jgi:hypothetical protein